MKRGKLHQARLEPWSTPELMAHLVTIVDAIAAEKDRAVSPLDVVLELLTGEFEAFVLFGRLGHLDPPRPDDMVPIAVLRRRSEDPEIDGAIRETALKWASEDGAKD